MMLSKSPKLVVSWKRPNHSGIHSGYLPSTDHSMVQIRVTEANDCDSSKTE